jgi:flagellar biosynthesis GTPase FlhF
VTKVIVNYSLGLRRFGRNGIFVRSIGTIRLGVVAIAFFVALFGSFAFGQDKAALSLNQVSDLVKQGISSNRIAQLVEQYGVGFELNEAAARRLRQDGADEVVLSAVKRMSARYAEEQQRKKRSEAEDAKRREQEEAQRRAERKKLEEQTKPRGSKKPEETAQGVEDIRKRLEEARKREEERRIKEEQTRQSPAVAQGMQEAPKKSEGAVVPLPFDQPPKAQEEAKQRPQKGPSPALRTPEEADRVASLRNVTSTPEGEVSGEIANNSTHTVRDVQLQILYSWRWKNETRPGKDDPGTVNYHSLNQEIPAGKTARFNYKPSPPLPPRTDGQFDVTVKIIGFAEIIPGVRK